MHIQKWRLHAIRCENKRLVGEILAEHFIGLLAGFRRLEFVMPEFKDLSSLRQIVADRLIGNSFRGRLLFAFLGDRRRNGGNCHAEKCKNQQGGSCGPMAYSK